MSHIVHNRRFLKAASGLALAAWALLLVGQLSSLAMASPAARNDLPKPAEAFGFEPGTEGQLADYDQIVAYLKKLDAASDRMILQTLGKTTEGNDFVMAIISSPKNLANLESLRQNMAKLADARKTSEAEARRIIESSPAVVLINCSIHSTEVGPAQMAPKLAYELCSLDDARTRRILDNVVTLLVPAHNPDGQKMVVEWYRKVKGTDYVRSGIPFLYHKYVGHDNNRDWFMFTQAETRITVEKIHNVWRPQLTLDMHQMGGNGARLFVPPYIDPVEPNVDPLLVAQIARAGSDVLATLTAEGKKGVVMNAIYDAWTPARAYMHYHHGVRFLTETASANLAESVTVRKEDLRGRFGFDPQRASWNFPDPWPGGKWTLADIVEYNRAAAHAVLDHVARHRDQWLDTFYQVARRALKPDSGPYAFVIPPEQHDPHAVKELVEVLQTAMVEVHQARGEFTADGARFPKGTLVVKSAQPYGAFARAMLQRQQYPEIREGGVLRRPYDVTAHTLPLFLGVDVVAVENEFSANLQLLDAPPAPQGSVENRNARMFLLSPNSNQAFRLVNAAFARGLSVARLTKALTINDRRWEPGTFVLQSPKGAGDIESLARQFGLTLVGAEAVPREQLMSLTAPRIGVYQSYWPVIDEGWTRWILEQYGFPYTTLHDRDIRAGNLNARFDVIVLPSQDKKRMIEGRAKGTLPDEYTGGLGDIGVRQLQSFVENGGTLLAFDEATSLPIEAFYLPVKNVLEGLRPDAFYCPGSVLRVYVKNDHPLGYGMPQQAAVLFVNSPAFSANEGETVVSYPPADPLLSGWLTGPQHLANRKALIAMRFGKGRIVLYGFRPQFRAQFRATYKLFFNGLLWASAGQAD